MNDTQLENQVLQVPIEDIIPNRFQPRLSFDDSSLQDLASSIKQHGIIQPLVLRRKNDKYEIIAGERRYKAAKMAGLAAVPAIISNLDDNSSAEVAIVENVQRKDLTAIEEAKSFKALLDKGYMTQEELARKMGLSQSAISNKLRLLTLDDSVQEAILQEKISERHARTLLKVEDKENQKNLLSKIINERLTVKQLEDEIRNIGEVPQSKTEPLYETPVVSTPTENSKDFESTSLIYDNPPIKPKEENFEPFFPKTPANAPSKFFNFIDNNMNTYEELTKDVEPAPVAEEIEMLDIEIPSITIEDDEDDLGEIVSKVRGLNLESKNVTVEELDLPTEYQIVIKINKKEE